MKDVVDEQIYLNQMSPTLIISPSTEVTKSDIVKGVFDDLSYVIMSSSLIVFIGIIWTSLQIDKYRSLTLNKPTFFEEYVLTKKSV